MKCTECKEYEKCRMENDLRRKRAKCSKAKDVYVPTNADRIRAMTDEEMAEILKILIQNDVCLNPSNSGSCDDCVFGAFCSAIAEEEVEDWLKQPAEVEA